MQRLALLSVVLATAACGGGGSDTGTATLSNADVMASAIEPFVGADGAGNQVQGWTILFYKDKPGGDCKSGTVTAKIGIYTNTPDGSGDQALLSTGGITIVEEAPPTLLGNAAANMNAMGVGEITGLVEITEFHLTPDAMHADHMSGNVSAGGYDENNAGVSLMGTFEAPICED